MDVFAAGGRVHARPPLHRGGTARRPAAPPRALGAASSGGGAPAPRPGRAGGLGRALGRIAANSSDSRSPCRAGDGGRRESTIVGWVQSAVDGESAVLPR